MINKMCKTGGFELPHMSPLKVKKPVEEKLQEFDRTPKRLDIKELGPLKQVVGSSGEVKEIDKDSLASDQAFEKIFQDYKTADKIGNPSEQDRWKEFLMENYSRSYNVDKGSIENIQPSNPEPGQDEFPSEADVQAIDSKFRIPERFNWEAYNKKFPRK